MEESEAVEPVEIPVVQREEIHLQIADEKVITVYRRENEQLRHDKMMLTIALEDTYGELQKLRKDFDEIVKKLPQGMAPSAVRRNNPKKKKGSKK